MSFLDYHFDLSDTPFDHQDLDRARNYWVSKIRTLAPHWLKKPRGTLGGHWRNEATQGARYLIELARVLMVLAANISSRSYAELETKIKELLHFDGRQYLAIETELLAMYLLSQKIAPISLKPLVPEELIGTDREPPSPDISVHVGLDEVFFEVTVLHVGRLDDWNRTVDNFADAIGKHVLRHNSRRLIAFTLPLAFRLERLTAKQARVIADFILESETGNLDLYLQNCDISIHWRDLSHIATSAKKVEDIVWPDSMTVATSFATFGPTGFVKSTSLQGVRMPLSMPLGTYARCCAATTDYSPPPGYAIVVQSLDEDLTDHILNSLRNTLKAKRKQFRLSKPYILVMSVGQDVVLSETLIQLIVKRIWNNPEYEWVSALCLFKTGTLGSEPGHMMLMPNPKAETLLPTAILEIFRNRNERRDDT